MPPRGPRFNGSWVPLMANYFMDPAIIRVGPWGELLYVRSLAAAKFINQDGYLSPEHLPLISRKIYDLQGTCDRLVREALWLSDPQVGGIWVRAWHKYNAPSSADQLLKDQAAARQRRHREKAKGSTATDVSHVTSQPLQTVQTNKQSRTDPLSGSGRSVTAADAPRRAEGAARPPLPGEVGSDPTEPPLVGDPKTIARENAARGRANNPAAGRPFSYRKQTRKPSASVGDLHSILDQIPTIPPSNGESQ